MTLVKKLPFKYDIKKLQDTLHHFLDDNPTIANVLNQQYQYYNNIGKTSGLTTVNVRDSEKNINLTQGTYFGKVFRDISSLYEINIVYLMKVAATSIISEHTDSTEVVLLPIISDGEYESIIDGKQISMPADGSIYLLNSLLPHIGNNKGKNPSYRLSFKIAYYRPKAIYEKWTNYA